MRRTLLHTHVRHPTVVSHLIITAIVKVSVFTQISRLLSLITPMNVMDKPLAELSLLVAKVKPVSSFMVTEFYRHSEKPQF